MIAFNYNHIKDLTICTTLPFQKKGLKNKKSIAVFEQTTSDLAYLAAKNIIINKEIETKEIGALVFLTKTPDYRGPATAMVIQKRLGIDQDCIVYDSPTGNSGFENGINLCASLLKSITQNFALVVFGDTISKQLSEKDIIESSFQDGATAVLLEKGETTKTVSLYSLALSKSWSSFMIPSGGFRKNDDFFNKLNSKKGHQYKDHLHIDFTNIKNTIFPEISILKNKISNIIYENDKSARAIIVNLLKPELENQLYSLFKNEAYLKDVYLSTKYFPQTMASTVPLMIEMVALENKKFPLHILSISLGEGLCLNISSLVVSENSVLETQNSDEFYENGYVTHEM